MNANNSEQRAVNNTNSPGPHRTHVCAGAPKFAEAAHVYLLRYIVVACQPGRNHMDVNNFKKRAVNDTNSLCTYRTHICAGAPKFTEVEHVYLLRYVVAACRPG
jgi:hypothetical protein